MAVANVDSVAVRLQLTELQLQHQYLQDNRLALHLFFQQAPAHEQHLEDQEQQVLEQIASLSSLIANDDQQVAPDSIQQEEASSHSQARAGWQTATQVAGSGMAEGKKRQGAQLQCGICFEWCPAHSMMSATLPGDVASSSRAAGRCSHKYCATCMEQYVGCELQTRKFPICCPSPECDEELSTADVLQLLGDHPHMMQLYQDLEAEAVIDSKYRVYCPFKDCSVLLERPEGEEGGPASGQQAAPYECPVCHRGFCLSCGITGWHEGMSCQQFQELPANLRSAEDAAMLQVAKQQQWKQCPTCRHMVERTHGCNHMRCRCGCDFCYACGVRYNTSADNEHGTQACTCRLFEVPAEEGDAVMPLRLNQVRQPVTRPWRNGRRVSLTPCRHAASIHDCPNGPGRCWFWHLEDDERAISEDGDSSSSSSSSSGEDNGEDGDTNGSIGEGNSEDGDSRSRSYNSDDSSGDGDNGSDNGGPAQCRWHRSMDDCDISIGRALARGVGIVCYALCKGAASAAQRAAERCVRQYVRMP